MSKSPPVEYVVARPTPPSWWRKYRHICTLIFGIGFGIWLCLNGYVSDAADRHDHDRPDKPSQSTTEPSRPGHSPSDVPMVSISPFDDNDRS